MLISIVIVCCVVVGGSVYTYALAKCVAPSKFLISDPAKMPVLDGAEAAYPVYSAFANACKEAFVFFVSNNNVTNNITTDQIKEIYLGKVKNWKSINDTDEKIWAFQRPENSGSQTIMQKVMGDVKLAVPLKNGIEPSDKNIRSGKYPYSVPLYAITLKNNNLETLPGFIEFMQGEQGQELAEKTGYVID